MPSGPRAGRIPSHRRGYWEDASLDSDPLGPLAVLGAPTPTPPSWALRGVRTMASLYQRGGDGIHTTFHDFLQSPLMRPQRLTRSPRMI